MTIGADEIIGTLIEAGVKVVFGIPSIHNIPLYEALRKNGSIRHILCRQEAAATHMADGYARSGNRLGVVISSTGPGTGYVIPALQEAWGACSPVLVVTTNIPSTKIGKGLGALHEMDNQDTIFRAITKATITVRPGKDIRALTRLAIDTALSGRPGPVYLEIPTDLLKGPFSSGGAYQGNNGKKVGGAAPDLELAISLLRKANQPVMMVGAGAVRAGIGGDITSLAEALAAPVITTTNGKGIIPEDHPLSFGNAARKGTVREMVQACDVALAIGTRLREVDAKRRGLVFPHLIHVEWDKRWVGKNFPAEVALLGDIRVTVKALLDSLRDGLGLTRRQRLAQEMHWRMERERLDVREERAEIKYLDAIRGVLPREGILVIDNTQLGYWAEYFYPSYFPGGLVAAKGSSIIGFAFAAAIGTKIACPQRPVVGLIGDGGFLYCAQELATCKRHGISFPVVVVNDNSFGVIEYLQHMAYQKSYESNLTNPDFLALARAFGAEAARAESPGELGESLEKALASGSSWVIELCARFPESPFGRY